MRAELKAKLKAKHPEPASDELEVISAEPYANKEETTFGVMIQTDPVMRDPADGFVGVCGPEPFEVGQELTTESMWITWTDIQAQYESEEAKDPSYANGGLVNKRNGTELFGIKPFNFKDGDTVYIAEGPVDDTDPENIIVTVEKTGQLEDVTFGDCTYTEEELNGMTKDEILDLAVMLGYEMTSTSSSTKAEIIAEFLTVQEQEK